MTTPLVTLPVGLRGVVNGKYDNECLTPLQTREARASYTPHDGQPATCILQRTQFTSFEEALFVSARMLCIGNRNDSQIMPRTDIVSKSWEQAFCVYDTIVGRVDKETKLDLSEVAGCCKYTA